MASEIAPNPKPDKEPRITRKDVIVMKQRMFRIGITLLGIGLVPIGYTQISASWPGSGFVAGILLVLGLQWLFTGIKLLVLGNGSEESFSTGAGDSEGAMTVAQH